MSAGGGGGTTHHDDGLRERAALFALDLLDPAEASAVERHLAGCGECAAEVEGLRATLAHLPHVLAPVEPRPEVRSRLLARIAGPAAGEPAGTAGAHGPAQSWKRWRPDDAALPIAVVPAGEGEWEHTGVEGVEVRRLFVDARNDRVTMLVRMAAGSSYPPHRHAGPEECYVLEGDIEAAGTRLHAGDYQRVDRGSVHDVQSTEGGCLLFIVSSLRDELLPRQA